MFATPWSSRHPWTSPVPAAAAIAAVLAADAGAITASQQRLRSRDHMRFIAASVGAATPARRRRRNSRRARGRRGRRGIAAIARFPSSHAPPPAATAGSV